MTPGPGAQFSAIACGNPGAEETRFSGAPVGRPRIRIAEPDRFSSSARRILEEVGEVVCEPCPRSRVREVFGRCDVFWFRLAYRIDASMLPDSPRCRILATPVTGLDHIDRDACRERGIEVVSLQGEVEFLRGVRATAELTAALTLALLRHLPEASRAAARGVWNRDLFAGRELFGKTAGLVGVGRLGSLVAGYFRAFGMDVMGYDVRSDFPHGLARRVDSLERMLPQCDVVSLHVPYGPESRGLIGRAEIATMKPDAVLVNTSRGGVLDEAALLEALEQGRLGGAALDVVKGEPDVRASHPVLRYARRHPNLIVVPHIGGCTSESFEKTEVFLARKVVALLRRGNR